MAVATLILAGALLASSAHAGKTPQAKGRAEIGRTGVSGLPIETDIGRPDTLVRPLEFATVMVSQHAPKNAVPSDDAIRTTEQIAQLMQWGEYALANQRFSEAEARFNDVLRLDWNHPQAFRLLQETRDRRKATLADWERAGQAALSKGDARLAIQYYEKIIGEDSTRQQVRSLLVKLQKQEHAGRLIQSGLSKFILENYAAAALDFEQALTIVPSDTLAALYRERTEQKMAGASSMADLRADTAMWAKYSDALKKLRAGDLAGAEQLWNAVLAKYPGNDAVRSNLEQIARRRKQELTSEDQTP